MYPLHIGILDSLQSSSVTPNYYLFGGPFLYYSPYNNNRIAATNYDGSDNTSFVIGTGFSAQVNDVVVDSAGNYYVATSATSYNGTTVPVGIVKLFANGTIDTSFSIGSGFSSAPSRLAIDNNGKIYACGAFSTYNGTAANRIVRLNTDGSIDTSFVYGTGFNQNTVKVIVTPSNGIYVIGNFTTYQGSTYNRIIKLLDNGNIDTSFSIGTGFSAQPINAIVDTADCIYVTTGTAYTYGATAVNGLVKILPNGTIDATFNVGTGFNNNVNSVSLDSNSRLVAVGAFTAYNGTSGVNYAVKLNPDGSIYNTFDYSIGANNSLNAARVTSIGTKSLIAGVFTYYNNVYTSGSVLLNDNGSIDTSFSTKSSESGITGVVNDTVNSRYIYFGTFQNFNVNSYRGFAKTLTTGAVDTNYIGNGKLAPANNVSYLAKDTSGKIYLVNGSNKINNVTSNGGFLARLDSSLQLDNTFNVGGTGFIALPRIGLQSTNKIVCLGNISLYNGATITGNIIRLNSDGSKDTSFNSGTGFSGTPSYLKIASNDKIYASGASFTSYNGNSSTRLVRLNADGSYDSTFVVGTGLNNVAPAIVPMINGSVYIAGSFTTYKGSSYNRILKIDNTGTVDTSFAIGTGFNNAVYDMVMDAAGKLYIIGNFTTYKGVTYNRIISLNNDGSVNSTFNIGGGFSTTTSSARIFYTTDNKLIVSPGAASGFSYNGNSYTGCIRLNLDGTVDTTFTNVLSSYPLDLLETYNPSSIALGASYQGGYIAYILQPGDPGYDANTKHGLIVYPNAAITRTSYGCTTGGDDYLYAWGFADVQTPQTQYLVGASGTAIGTGLTNSNAINNSSYYTGSTPPTVKCQNGVAVQLRRFPSDNSVLGSYTDWYVPSRDELGKVYLNRDFLPYSFGTAYPYWTSSEVSQTNATGMKFADGTFTSYVKNEQYGYVLPMRSF